MSSGAPYRLDQRASDDGPLLFSVGFGFLDGSTFPLAYYGVECSIRPLGGCGSALALTQESGVSVQLGAVGYVTIQHQGLRCGAYHYAIALRDSTTNEIASMLCEGTLTIGDGGFNSAGDRTVWPDYGFGWGYFG